MNSFTKQRRQFTKNISIEDTIAYFSDDLMEWKEITNEKCKNTYDIYKIKCELAKTYVDKYSTCLGNIDSSELAFTNWYQISGINSFDSFVNNMVTLAEVTQDAKECVVGRIDYKLKCVDTAHYALTESHDFTIKLTFYNYACLKRLLEIVNSKYELYKYQINMRRNEEDRLLYRIDDIARSSGIHVTGK